jgi:AraC family transcriptional regulator
MKEPELDFFSLYISIQTPLSMTARIETIQEKKLVGMRMLMCHGKYRMGELWGRFMPRRKEIAGQLTNDLISLAVYAPGHFTRFNPDREFERWATVEVSDFDEVPNQMETIRWPGGLYAVFHYAGSAAGISGFYQEIYGVWLPGSGYVLDERPHAEVMGEKYSNNDPASEETIWIPIKPKTKFD